MRCTADNTPSKTESRPELVQSSERVVELAVGAGAAADLPGRILVEQVLDDQVDLRLPALVFQQVVVSREIKVEARAHAIDVHGVRERRTVAWIVRPNQGRVD